MIENIKKHKILTLVGIVLVVGAAWAMLSSNGGPQQEALLGSSSLPASADGITTVSAADRELQEILSKVRAIQLQSTLFTDPAFLNLQDVGQQIIAEPIGRSNPFAPLSE